MCNFKSRTFDIKSFLWLCMGRWLLSTALTSWNLHYTCAFHSCQWRKLPLQCFLVTGDVEPSIYSSYTVHMYLASFSTNPSIWLLHVYKYGEGRPGRFHHFQWCQGARAVLKEEAGTLLCNVRLSKDGTLTAEAVVSVQALESQKIWKHYSLLRQVLQSEAPPCLSFA